MKPILQKGHPATEVLHEKAKEVPQDLFNTKQLATMLDDMKKAVDAQDDGLAIAAPQIGIPYRIFIVRFDRLSLPPEGQDEGPADYGIFINPIITKRSKKTEVMDEGCLSVRGITGKTKRNVRATVRAQDFMGDFFERGGGGVLAQAYQHEIDHLDGILFVDVALETKPDNRND